MVRLDIVTGIYTVWQDLIEYIRTIYSMTGINGV